MCQPGCQLFYYLEEHGFWPVEFGTPKELALTWQIGFLRCYQASGKFLQGDIFHFGKAKLLLPFDALLLAKQVVTLSYELLSW